MNDEFESKDKQIVPFLFTQSSIRFLGTRVVGQTIYFRFTPYSNCLELVNSFISKKAPPVQAKDLLDAVESFRDVIFEMKEKTKYGGS